MKKLFFLTIAIFALFQVPSALEYELLQIKASLSPRRLSRGQEGEIVLKFTVAESIVINSLPNFIIELDPLEELVFPKDFFSASDLEIKVIEENGKEFLDLTEPVNIPFTVKLSAKRGNHTVTGKIKYFACSKEEGWCLKDKTTFSASFYTSNRIVQKKH